MSDAVRRLTPLHERAGAPGHYDQAYINRAGEVGHIYRQGARTVALENLGLPGGHRAIDLQLRHTANAYVEIECYTEDDTVWWVAGSFDSGFSASSPWSQCLGSFSRPLGN